MKIVNRILRSIAPSFQMRRQVQTDEWSKMMMMHLHMSFIKDKHGNDDPVSDFLQTQKEPLRNSMIQYLIDKINYVADSSDRILACRHWTLEEMKKYAPIRALFVPSETYSQEVNSGARHPLNRGLWDDIDQIINHSLQPLLDEYGSVDEVINFLRRESLWLHARVSFANYGRLLLKDMADFHGQDWFKRLMQLLVAEAEVDYIEFIGGQPPIEGADKLQEDVKEIELFLNGIE